MTTNADRWNAAGVSVAVAVAILSANAYLMKIVIKSCIDEAMLNISKEYVTKADLDKHVEIFHLNKVDK